MINWRAALLNGYYQALWPYRVLALGRARRSGSMPIIGVYYHRVSDDRATPWTISRSAFERQINWLQAHCDLVSLAEAQRRIRSGMNRRPTVTITFDDGYADNCDFALPLLVERGIPCHYFVTWEPVTRQIPFAHDVRLGRPAAPNTVAELRTWAARGIEIGCHTRTHTVVSTLQTELQLLDELVAVRDEMQTELKQPLDYFAFPCGQQGDLTVRAFAVAREAGYRGVCSAYGGYNLPGDDAFHLQRLGPGEPLITIKNYVGLDPRKRRISRFSDATPHDRTDPSAPARLRAGESLVAGGIG